MRRLHLLWENFCRDVHMCPNRSERVKEVFLKAPLPLLAIHFRLYKFLIKLNPLNSLPLNMTLKELFPAAYTRHSGIKLLNLKTKKKKIVYIWFNELFFIYAKYEEEHKIR